MKGFLQISGVRGNSSDPYHAGWIELDKLNVIPDAGARRPRGAGTAWVPPLLVHCSAVIGSFSLTLHMAADTGQQFASAVLDIAGDDAPSVARTRIHMQQVHLSAYELIRDAGLRKPHARFTLTADAHRYHRRVPLEVDFSHEAAHAR